jgi:DNA-binding CsgD family transcriptional regulator/tetratricopeptide (TPR) repeat protein
VPLRVSSPQFVGRDGELAALSAALDRVVAGRFQAVFVAGESGVGKSRLLHELEREAEARGARVLVGECVTLAEGEQPYAPIRAALRELGVDLADLGAPEGPAADASARARLFERVLARLATEGPVLLNVEDIHWADRSTLDLLSFLIVNARREALLLACSYRTDEVDRRHPLRAFLVRHERPPAARRLELRPFTVGELEVQLRGILGADPDPGLVERLHARSEGNPFFTEELLAASADGTELPASLRDALMLRIDALAPDAQRLVRVAAARGREIGHRLLAAACELPDDDLDGAVREAVDRHVMVQRTSGSLAFRHMLFAEAVEADLLPGERARRHLALAEAIDREPALADRDGRAAAELAAHWLAAHRLPEALAAAVRAGRESEAVYAFAEAGDHFARALGLWPRVHDARTHAGMDEHELYARAAEATQLGGDNSAAVALIEAAIERVDPVGDPYRAALLRERLGHYLWMSAGDEDAAQRAYEEAVALLPADEPRPELARVLATLGQFLMLRGRLDESMERCEQALDVARRTGALGARAVALNALGGNLAFRGARGVGIEHLRESLRLSEELGDIDNLGRAYVNLGEVLDQDARVEEAFRTAVDGARRCEDVGMGEMSLLLQSEAASRAFKLGRLEEADGLTRWADGLQPSIAKLNGCAVRARVEVQRERLVDAEPLLDAAAGAMPYARTTWTEPLASARVETELLRGDPAEARRLVEEALEAGDHAQLAFVARLHALGARAGAELAERARASGDEQAAAEAARRAQALAERIDRRLDPGAWDGAPPPEAVAYGAACAAEVARAVGSSDAAQWARLAEVWSGLRLRLEEAYARLREAECLLLDGRRKLARHAVLAGGRLAREAGAVWLEHQLDALARRGRLAPAEHGAGDDAVGLTDREREVLELVALGLTNREIGERLFMATKTASVHVSRIFTKLGVGSRVEAAMAAQRLGLAPEQ